MANPWRKWHSEGDSPCSGRIPRTWLKPGDTVVFPAGEIHQVSAITRMVLYRVHAGADRQAKMVEGWPTR